MRGCCCNSNSIQRLLYTYIFYVHKTPTQVSHLLPFLNVMHTHDRKNNHDSPSRVCKEYYPACVKKRIPTFPR